MAMTRAWRGLASWSARGAVALVPLVSFAAASCGSDDTSSPSGSGDGGADAAPASRNDAGDDETRVDASAPTADASAPPVEDASVPVGDATAPVDAGSNGPLNHLSFDGVVNAARHVGSSWYIGGAFTRASSHTASNILALDPTGTPTRCPLGTSFDGRINAVASDGTSIYVGGEFTHYQGVPAARIAKIDATTCALATAFSPPMDNNGFDAEPSAFAISGTSLYVGGQFSAYRGVADSANHLAKLDLATGALDTTFSPNGATANGFDLDVTALLVTNGSLYVGGFFGAYRGVSNSAHHLAKLDLASGAIDTTFGPAGAISNGFNNPVYALAASATSLYVGGSFTSYKGVTSSANLVAKVDLTSGAIDTTFSPAGATSNGFTGPTTPTAVPTVLALAYSGTSLYVGGRFTAYKSAASTGNAERIAKLDGASGALDTTFSPVPGVSANNGFDNTVEALVASGTELYVGGLFNAYRGVAASAHGLAKLDLGSGTQSTSFLPPGESANGVSGSVTSEVFAGTTLWIAGAFTVYGGASVNNIAKLDDVTYAVDTGFSPPANNGFLGSVFALASSGTSLYVGGEFTGYRGDASSAISLAKLDLTSGALDTTFSPVGALANGFTEDGASAQVTSLAVSATSLYVGGEFDEYRGAAHSANNIAKLDLTTGALDTTFTPAGATANGFDVSVQALAFAGTSIYAGGDFTMYKGVANSAHDLAKLDAITGAIDTAFSPVGATSNGFDNVVFALAASDTSLYIGGLFDAYRGVANSANNLAKVDLVTGALDTTFSPAGASSNGFDSSGEVTALAIGNGYLYIAGAFTDYRGVANSANRLAKVDLVTGALDTTFSPAGVTANGVDAPSYAIGVSATAVAVGGQFAQYRGGPMLRENLDFVDPTTGAALE